MNKAEFTRMQEKLGGTVPHLLLSASYGVWFCLAETCIGQGATREEAYANWDRINIVHHAGKRHTAQVVGP